MGRTRNLIIVALALLVPARAAAAEPPQVYIGSAPGYSIAFKVEGGNVYMLGLDATVYCQVSRSGPGPRQVVRSFFRAPQLMGQSGDNPLTAADEHGGAHVYQQLVVTAELGPAGEKVVGSFEYHQGEEGEVCNSASYSAYESEAPFEAVRYVPASGSTPAPPFAFGGTAFYLGAEGPVETFFTVSASHLVLRGAVVSPCQVGTKRRAAGRGPLSPEALRVGLDPGGAFRRQELPPPKFPWHREAMVVAGSVGDEAITGSFRRRVVLRSYEVEGKRVCETGPLPFRAQRYLPATP